MPNSKRAKESDWVDDKARLPALRDAVRLGIEDMDAGRFIAFDSPGELRRYLSARTKKIIAETQRAKRSPPTPDTCAS